LSTKWPLLASLLLALPLSACSQEVTTTDHTSTPLQVSEAKFTLNITGVRAHPKQLFTQGLFFWNGNLYESSGLRGQSALIKYNSDVSSISVQRKLGDQYFAEGSTAHNNSIYQLTWTSGKAFVYKGAMLSPIAEEGFEYEGEGWGLTSDGENLWLSDGTDELRVLDEKGTVVKRITATHHEQPLDRLNELEWVNGWLLANRWYDNRIFVINPNTGKTEAAFNLAQIAAPQAKENNQRVLNGIAWNARTQTLWITGKNWDRFYLANIQLPDVSK